MPFKFLSPELIIISSCKDAKSYEMQYHSPSSAACTEVENSTQWYLESLERKSLSPETKMQYCDLVEIDMAEMNSMSESELLNLKGKTLQEKLPKRHSRTAAAALQVEMKYHSINLRSRK